MLITIKYAIQSNYRNFFLSFFVPLFCLPRTHTQSFFFPSLQEQIAFTKISARLKLPSPIQSMKQGESLLSTMFINEHFELQTFVWFDTLTLNKSHWIFFFTSDFVKSKSPTIPCFRFTAKTLFPCRDPCTILAPCNACRPWATPFITFNAS